MPWYKIFADHGGGHMSHTEFYEWHNLPLSKKQRKERWQEAFDSSNGYYSWPIGDVILVKGLPQDVLLAKRKANFVRVALAEAAVLEAKAETIKIGKILADTKQLPCSHAYTKSFEMPKGILSPPVTQCKTCGKLRTYHKDIDGWIKPPKDLVRFAKKIACKKE